MRFVIMTDEEIRTRRVVIHHLRYTEHWTLQAIADKFGISRQRVQQILGNTGWISSKSLK